jgi:hypothetical protein
MLLYEYDFQCHTMPYKVLTLPVTKGVTVSTCRRIERHVPTKDFLADVAPHDDWPPANAVVLAPPHTTCSKRAGQEWLVAFDACIFSFCALVVLVLDGIGTSAQNLVGAISFVYATANGETIDAET